MWMAVSHIVLLLFGGAGGDRSNVKPRLQGAEG